MDETKYNDKTALITGGTGFIGKHLSKRLADAGARVHVISNEGDADSGVKIHKADMLDKKRIHELVKSIMPDFVFHLAADRNRERSVESFYNLINVNIMGSFNLLEALVNSECLVPTITYGTAEEYGDNKPPFTEQMREDPVSPYSFSKLSSTRLLKMFYKLYSLPTTVLRPTIAYGPGQMIDMFIPSVIKSLSMNKPFKMTAGEQTRDFIFIDDLVEATLTVPQCQDKAKGEIINIGYGIPYKIKDVARKISVIMGKENLVEYGAIPYRASEMMNYYVDTGKAGNLLGWKPKTDIDKGLGITIEKFE